MTRRAGVSFCAAGLMLLAASHVSAERIALTTEHSFPAVMMEQGQIIGYGTEKVREIMRRAGIDYSIDLLPWMRAYTLARTRLDTCVYATTRTPEREPLFSWVGPIVATDWILYGRRDRHLPLSSLEQARGLRIGAYNGDVRGNYLAARGFKVDLVQDDASNPKKLMLGRIDLWVTSPRFAELHLEKAGLADQIEPKLNFKRVDLYIACNRVLAPELIARMQGALETMNADGTSAAIERKYDNWQAPAAKRSTTQ